jgi:hypothetical protein
MAASGFIDWPFGDGYMPAPMAETLRRLFRNIEENGPEQSMIAGPQPAGPRPDRSGNGRESLLNGGMANGITGSTG